MPSIDYWKTTTDVTVPGFGSFEVDFSQLSINGNVRYYFPTGGNVDLFALGGLAWVRGKAEVSGQSESDSQIGLNLGGGTENTFVR